MFILDDGRTLWVVLSFSGIDHTWNEPGVGRLVDLPLGEAMPLVTASGRALTT
jgi:hypothetical protein